MCAKGTAVKDTINDSTSRNAGGLWRAACLSGTAAVLLPVSGPAIAQTIVGPSPPTITTTVNVASGLTIIVGSTNIATVGATNATNVTGGTLTLDSTAGPLPGPISIQTVNGNALQANGGIITVPNGGVNIQTGGGHGVLANGAASSVTLNGASITTTGVGAALAAIGGVIDATGVTMTGTAGSSGHGAVAESGGIINLHTGTSITRGTGFNSVGIGASGAGSQVNATALIPVTMQGSGAMGIYLHDGGQVNLQPGSTLQMNGTGSVGLSADNATVTAANLRNLTINLNGSGAGASSTGVVAFNGGSVTLENLTVTGANAAAGVWARPGSSITLSGQSVININAPSNPTFYTLLTPNLVTPSGQVGSAFGATGGIPAAGLKADGPGGSVTSTDTTINVTSGNGAAGANTSFGGSIDMTRNTIVTTGTNSFGVRVDSGQVIGRDSSVTTSGGGAALFFNFGPGLIDLTNTNVLATGANTDGLDSLNGTPSSLNTFRLSGGSLISTDGVAIAAQGPLNVTTTNGAVVTGGDALLRAFNQSAFFPQPTVVQLDASGGSILTGDAFAEPLAIANINLTTGSRWTGAAFDVTNVSVDPTSTWTMTASSTVTQQVTNAGLIDFTPPVGGVFKTLTTQNYLGTGGTIRLNTFLGDDSSPSDRLVINGGTATGNSLLRIVNAGGPGAQTVANGILVVETINGGTTAPGTFSLANVVAAGAFEYSLFRGSVDASGPQNWYLRSVGIRPDVPVHSGLPPLGTQFGFTMVGTFHERFGDPLSATGVKLDCRQPGYWGRILGERGRRNHNDFFANGPDYSWRIAGLQSGADLLRRGEPGDICDRAGFYIGAGTVGANVDHLRELAPGVINMEAVSLGGYWVRLAPSGWYLETIAQGTWYDADATTVSTSLKANGHGVAGSVETGYPFDIGGGLLLEPQAQLIYQRVKFGDVADETALISLKPTEALQGRVGARLVQPWSTGAAWVRANVWHEFIGKTTIALASLTGDNGVTVQAPFRGTWGEIGFGASGLVSARVALFATAAYQHSIDNRHRESWNGRAGMRVDW